MATRTATHGASAKDPELLAVIQGWCKDVGIKKNSARARAPVIVAAEDPDDVYTTPENCKKDGCCSDEGVYGGSCRHMEGGCWHDSGIQQIVEESDLEMRGHLWFSSSVSALRTVHAGTLCCVDNTHLYLRDYLKAEYFFVVLPLQFLVVQVDTENHCSFSLHLNIKSTHRTEPHFFLHALTNQARNKWLCVLAKHSVPIHMKDMHSSTVLCAGKLPGVFDTFEDQHTWRRVIWI